MDIEDRTSSQRPRPRANNVFGGQVRQQVLYNYYNVSYLPQSFR